MRVLQGPTVQALAARLAEAVVAVHEKLPGDALGRAPRARSCLLCALHASNAAQPDGACSLPHAQALNA